MTIRVIRKAATSSPKKALAVEDSETCGPVQLTAHVPSPIRSPEPDDPDCQISAGHGATVAAEEIHDSALAGEVNSSDTLRLTRDKAASYLRTAGYPITKQRLAKLAVSGDGPEYSRWGSRVLYDPTMLMKWAKDREITPDRPAHQPVT